MTSLKLYQLDRSGGDYDLVYSFAIRARTPRKARKLAAEQCGGEGAAVWLSKKVICTLIGYALPKDTVEEVLVRDFLAG